MKRLLFIVLTALWTAVSFASVKDTIIFVPSETHAANYNITSIKLDDISVSTTASGNLSNTDYYSISGRIAISSKKIGKIKKIILIGYNGNGSKGHSIDNFNSDKIKDTKNNLAHWESETGTDSITVTVNSKKTTVYLSRIEVYIDRDSEEINIGKYGYATFSSKHALNFEGSNVKSFIVDGKEEGKAYLKETGQVPGNTGLVLKADSGKYFVPVLESADSVGNNLLFSTAYENVISDGNCYVLGIKGGVIGFYKVPESWKIPKKRSYLRSENEAKGFTFSFDETTAIKTIEGASKKAVNTKSYNLFGQPVGNNYKGIVIRNGKKFIKH